MEPEIPHIKMNDGLPAYSEKIVVSKIELNDNKKNTEIKKILRLPKMKKVFNFKFKFNKKRKKYLLIFGGALILLLSFCFFSAYKLYAKGMELKTAASNLQNAVKEQNLDKVKSELNNTNSALVGFKKSYRLVAWTKIIPIVGRYTSDGQHALNAASYSMEAAKIIIIAIEPYADIIGFSSGTDKAASGEETTQDRIDFIIKTIPELIPKADELTQKVDSIRKEVDQIDSERYPNEFAGMKVRENVKRLVDAVDLGSQLVNNGKPLLEAAPYLLGSQSERRYLVIFQNDKELRPTGGFITAYSISKVDKGKFEPVESDDIYNLDNKYQPTIAAPEPIVKYLKGPYLISKNLRLRDMNWSPDYKVTMDLFGQEIKKVGIENIDGIIAVDTQVLVYILDAIGPIGVTGFGNYSTEIIPECNCPQVIYELESFADVEGPIVWSENEPGKIVFAPPNYDNRKKIIGPLMNAILSNALGQPKEKLPLLFEAAFKALLEKHVLFYVYDQKAQAAVEKFGIGGIVSQTDGDYLYIVDSNLGGRKSNLYAREEVSQKVEIAKDGSITKELIITYKNPEKQDGWLNSVLPNFVRIYVPKDSELLSIDGLEEKKDAYEEFDKTVFSGYFQLRPLGVAKLTLKYKLRDKFKDEYKLLIQKQPGKDKPLYSIKIGKKNEEFFLKTDKEIRIAI